jgi:type VI secretion system protein ImpH
MATPGGGTTTAVTAESQRTTVDAPPGAPGPHLAAMPSEPVQGPPSLAQRLFQEGYAFDFFQAVRILEKLDPQRQPVGLDGPPFQETVRFLAHQSLSFPASQIYEIQPATPERPVPALTVTFMGLTGPSGVLPLPYTELLLRLQKSERWPEQHALRDWLDLFNHRLISLFYRAWEKYRFYLPYERGQYARPEPDTFTRVLYSLVGVGQPSLRNRLQVFQWQKVVVDEIEQKQPKTLAAIEDLALAFYSGLLAHRPRCAVSLEALIRDYFQLPVQVVQFQGQWLQLDRSNQSAVGATLHNNQLGVDAVAGERVWDVQGKFRIRLGPLGYNQFLEFTPDRAPQPQRKAFFLLVHLVRLYVGPELEFDVQMILQADQVPDCQLVPSGSGIGPRLGWNTWLCSLARATDAEDACFEGQEQFAL